MKFKFLLSFLIAGAAVASAQGYKDGINYYRADMPEEAAIILNRTINNASTDKALANYYLGQIELAGGNQTQARNYFDAGVTANPKCGYNYVGLGQLALTNGEKAAAENYFKQAKDCDKKDAQLLTDIARAYWTVDGVKYDKEVKKWIAEARKVNKECPAIYVLEADMKADNNIGEAAGYYEMAMNYDVNNEHPEAYVKYARTYFRVNPEYAINGLKQLLQKQPNSALAQSELAEKYYDNNQLTLAAEQYGQYIKNPNHFKKDEQRYVGLLFFGKKYDDSLNLAKKLLSEDPENFYMKRMVFLNYAALENNQLALEAANDFFNSKGEFTTNDYTTLGEVLHALGDEAGSVAAYEKAVEISPEKVALLKDLSSAYTQADMLPQAAEAMQKYIDAGDFSVNDMLILSRRYQNVAGTSEKGSPERAQAVGKALEAINYVIERVPDNPQVLSTLAKVQLLESDGTITPEVVDTYKNIISIFEAKPELSTSDKNDLFTAYNFMGSYSLENKNLEDAGYYFNKMLELRPDNDQLREFVEKTFPQ